MPMSRLGTDTRNQIAKTVTQSFRPALLLQPFANSVISSMQDTQESAICGGLMEPVLGSNCFAVRGIFFNK
jgi:hypothetical protein